MRGQVATFQIRPGSNGGTRGMPDRDHPLKLPDFALDPTAHHRVCNTGPRKVSCRVVDTEHDTSTGRGSCAFSNVRSADWCANI